MAKPYRRRKGGKRGPFVGNFRVSVGGKDLNLGTKDANEAHRRAALAVKGHWPPDEAAARAARRMIDPSSVAGPAVSTLMDEPTADPPAAAPVVSGAPAAGDLPGVAAATADSQDAPAPQPPGPGLDAAVAAAAGEAAGVSEEVAATKAEREAQVEGELAEIMGELTAGSGGGEMVDSVCDGAAAAILWLERKGVELGWKWTFQKTTKKALIAGPQPEPGDLSRKCLRVGLKAIAVVHFPELASKLTPGWAIAIGLVAGGMGAIGGGTLVNIETGERQPVAAAAEAAAAEMQGAPTTNSAAPAA